MNGKIILKAEADKKGIIRGIDEKRYYYQKEQLIAGQPKVGDTVDFESEDDHAMAICVLSDSQTGINLNNLKEKINHEEWQQKTKEVFNQSGAAVSRLQSIKNIPGVIISTVFLIALMFPLFNIKFMGYSMGMHEEQDPTNNLIMTFLILITLGSIVIFSLDLDRKYWKIASLSLLVLFIGLSITAFTSVSEINQAAQQTQEATSQLLGSSDFQTGMDGMSIKAKVIPQFGYYLAALALLGNIYFSFIFKK